MELISNKNLYNCILIFANLQSKVNFQLIVFSYAQLLKKLGASNISAVNKSEYELSYPIKKVTDVQFVEFSFNLSPRAIKLFQQSLRLDESVLRCFLTSKK